MMNLRGLQLLSSFPDQSAPAYKCIGRFHLGISSHESSSAALCDNPVDIDNGMVTFNGNSIGDMAAYTCDLGFELIGDANTTCTLSDIDSAEFQPAPPSCRREYTE